MSVSCSGMILRGRDRKVLGTLGKHATKKNDLVRIPHRFLLTSPTSSSCVVQTARIDMKNIHRNVGVLPVTLTRELSTKTTNEAVASYAQGSIASWDITEMVAAATALFTTLGLAAGASQAVLGFTPKREASTTLVNTSQDTRLAADDEMNTFYSAQSTLANVPQERPQRLIEQLPQKPLSLPTSRNFDVSVRALKGRRLSMEDEYIVSDGGKFAAVFDGHGGSGVSRYLRDSLYKRYQYFMGEVQDETRDIGNSTAANESLARGARNEFNSNVVRRSPSRGLNISMSHQIDSLRSAFRAIEREVLSDDRFHFMGSTAVAVTFHSHEDLNYVLVANIGDSRAVLSSGGKAVNLTKDHKPNNSTELSRIMALGEKVEWDGFVHRVRDLSLSRAIGDRFAKPAVSGKVDITQHLIKEEDEFVVLASDGLWDVMSSQEAVSFVHRKMVDFDNGLASQLLNVDIQNTHVVNTWKRKQMSRFLANEAMRRGTLDNVCVIIVWLKKEGHDDVKAIHT